MPSGKLLHNYGKSPFFMGNSTKWPFSKAFCTFTRPGRPPTGPTSCQGATCTSARVPQQRLPSDEETQRQRQGQLQTERGLPHRVEKGRFGLESHEIFWMLVTFSEKPVIKSLYCDNNWNIRIIVTLNRDKHYIITILQ